MARKKKDWSTTWFGVTVARVGVKEARKVMEFATCWAITTAALDRPPKNIAEYSEWWGQSMATGYREWDHWKAAWPEYHTPTDWFDSVGFEPRRAPRGGLESMFLSTEAIT